MQFRQLGTGMGAVALVGGAVVAAPPMPNEFDAPGDALAPLFAYFGGVLTWGTETTPEVIYEGPSLQVSAELVDDPFAVAGFAVGTFGTTPPELNVAPGSDTFSLTIQAPEEGQLSVSVIVREDDNGDGIIDAGESDDQWESPTLLLQPGTVVYNISADLFVDVDTDVGNNVQNFDTTGRLAYMLVFESRDSYEGGKIIGPVSFLVDHVGFYVGAQTLPGADPADLNGDSQVDVSDLLILLGAWGSCPAEPGPCVADIDENGVVDVTDLLTLLSNWSP